MVIIKKIIREYKRERNEYTGFEWIDYLESEENYINRVENLCNTIGGNSIHTIFYERLTYRYLCYYL